MVSASIADYRCCSALFLSLLFEQCHGRMTHGSVSLSTENIVSFDVNNLTLTQLGQGQVAKSVFVMPNR